MKARVLPNLKTNIQVLPPVMSRYMSRVPFIFAAVGHTGSGKSHLCLGMIKLMLREGSLNKIYLISPTASSNVVYKSVFDETRDVLFEDLGIKVFDFLNWVQQDCINRANAYAEALMYQVAYKRYTSGEVIDNRDEQLLETHGYRNLVAVRPKSVLLIDDASHSQIFSTSQRNPFVNLVLRSRHVGDGCGLSIAMVAQSYRGRHS